MAEIENKKTSRENALEIAKILSDSKAENVAVLGVGALSSWTDFFIIATVTSSAQMQGLHRLIKEYVRENGMEIHVAHQKHDSGSDWNLIDIGPVVVHLMSAQARDFYELEKLWHEGERIL